MRAILTAGARWAPWALRELDARLPPFARRDPLAPGVWLVACGGSTASLARTLADTVFIRHLSPAPVDRPVGPAEDPATWTRAALPAVLAELPGWPPGGAVQAQARVLEGGPPWTAGALAAAVRSVLAEAGARVTGGPAPYVLSIVAARVAVFVGLAPRPVHLSPWPGGAARLAALPGEVSRSARKLEEALLLGGEGWGPPCPGAAALDLGAAPGGWTQVLLRKGWRVTAVDPGAPSPALVGARGLSWIRGSASQIPLPPGPFDLLTADLNWDPLRTAACALRFRPRLRAGARGILTVKFFGGDPLDTVAAVRGRLEAGFRVLAVRHLFHDRAEATAFLAR